MPILGNILGTIFKNLNKAGGLPACVKDIAVAWYKNLSNVIIDSNPPNPLTVSTPTEWDENNNVTLSGGRVTGVDAGVGYAVSIYKLAGDGYVEFEISSSLAVLALNTVINESIVSQTEAEYGIFHAGSGEFFTILNDVLTNNIVGIGVGDILRIERSGTDLLYRYSTDGGSNFTTQRTESVGLSDLFIQVNTVNLSALYMDDISIGGASYRDPIYSVSDVIKDEIGIDTRQVYYGQYLTSSSGQINLYRSSGTYDYIDPSDGSSVTGNTIPASGLITVPVGGICEITTSDGSRYPICERVGDVLHDVLENSKHISVDTAVWDETLYGSDYLNQYGYVTKSDSDAEGYDWETTVNGLAVALNDNTLVPLGLWEYVDLLDINGDFVLDVDDLQIQVKKNI